MKIISSILLIIIVIMFSPIYLIGYMVGFLTKPMFEGFKEGAIGIGHISKILNKQIRK